MRKIYKLCFTVIVAICFYQSTMAQQTPIGTSKGLMDGIKQKASAAANLKTSNSIIALQISDKKSVNGKINFKKSDPTSEFLIGEIDNVSGSSFYLKVNDNSLEGHILFKATKEAYKYTSDANGNAYVTKT